MKPLHILCFAHEDLVKWSKVVCTGEELLKCLGILAFSQHHLSGGFSSPSGLFSARTGRKPAMRKLNRDSAPACPSPFRELTVRIECHVLLLLGFLVCFPQIIVNLIFSLCVYLVSFFKSFLQVETSIIDFKTLLFQDMS